MPHKCPKEAREYHRNYYLLKRQEKLNAAKTRYELRRLMSSPSRSECPIYSEKREAAFREKMRVKSKEVRSSWSPEERSARACIASARRRSDLDHETLYGGSDHIEVLSMTIEFVKLRIEKSAREGIEFHVDHKKPLSKGGTHTRENLRVIPASENQSKHAWWQEEYENMTEEEINDADAQAIQFADNLNKGRST